MIELLFNHTIQLLYLYAVQMLQDITNIKTADAFWSSVGQLHGMHTLCTRDYKLIHCSDMNVTK